MRDEYDFSKARKNPYSTQLKKSITIRLDEDSVDYFKAISEEVGIPYQTLINLYLRDCATSHRKLNLNWKWFRAVSDIFSWASSVLIWPDSGPSRITIVNLSYYFLRLMTNSYTPQKLRKLLQ